MGIAALIKVVFALEGAPKMVLWVRPPFDWLMSGGVLESHLGFVAQAA